MITEIRNDADLDREFIDKKGFVLLELGASWCRPCQVMAPAFKGVEEEFKGEVRLCHIDVDEAEDLAARFAPEGIPTFIFYKDGKELGRIIGYRQKNKFFEDIATINELRAISQRLCVAKMLTDKNVYTEIAEKTKASTATISRVNKCLNYGQGGYGLVLERLKAKESEN